jgi:hypothetical protein
VNATKIAKVHVPPVVLSGSTGAHWPSKVDTRYRQPRRCSSHAPSVRQSLDDGECVSSVARVLIRQSWHTKERITGRLRVLLVSSPDKH